MLKVTVFEKGGEDRVLFFDGDAVKIGRVQGNDIVLPKPNVSKRHAGIRVAEDVLVVEDLRSTNGTYVNGRRITTPRELGPEDRIHIGDYMLQAEVTEQAAEGESGPQPAPPLADQFRATQAMPAVQMDDAPSAATPLEDEDVPIVLDVEVLADDEPSQVEPPPVFEDIPVAPPVPQPEAEASVSVVHEAREDSAVAEGTAPGVRGQAAAMVRRAAPVAADASDGPAEDDYMDALRVVSEMAEGEVFSSVDPLKNEFGDDEWQQLSDRLMRLIDRLRRENRFPAAVDPFALTQDVLFEFTGLGPLEELLGDSAVRTIMVDGLDRIFVNRGGGMERLPKGFANEVTQGRVVMKLLALAGLDSAEGGAVEGRLPDGTFLHMVNPPLASEGRVIVLERPAATSLTLSDFVSAGLMVQEAHDALLERVRLHANIVVCGCSRSGQGAFLNALLRALPATDRVVLLEGRREIAVTQANVVALNKGPLAAMGAAAAQVVHRLLPDLVVVPDLEVADVAILSGLGLVGQRGLVTSMVADSWRTCVNRLAMMVQFLSPQMRPETTERVVGQVLDCIVVLRPGEGGRSRVAQVVLFDRNGGEPRVIGDADTPA
jgi:pilus assembly protein CpaF